MKTLEKRTGISEKETLSKNSSKKILDFGPYSKLLWFEALKKREITSFFFLKSKVPICDLSIPSLSIINTDTSAILFHWLFIGCRSFPVYKSLSKFSCLWFPIKFVIELSFSKKKMDFINAPYLKSQETNDRKKRIWYSRLNINYTTEWVFQHG